MKIEKPIFQIIDIVRLHRKKIEYTTKNKSCYVLSCRLKGCSVFNFNNEKHIVNRGDILYIPLGSSYSQHTEGEEIVFFHLNAIGKTNDEIKIITPKNPDEVCDIFSKANKLWNKDQSLGFYECQQYLYKIMSLFDCASPQINSADTLTPILSYIHEHLCDPNLSLDAACKQAYICRVYFNKLFKRTYQTTPVRYINERRIERAKILLTSGVYTREEVAYLCGYNDVKYFYSVFKTISGMTTKQYYNSIMNVTEIQEVRY